MTPKNTERANRAYAALETWRAERGDGADESNARDLISDLLHLVEMQNDPHHEGAEDSTEKARGQFDSAWRCYNGEREDQEGG